MAFVPAPGVVECVVGGTYFGQPWVNVFHIKKEGGTSSASTADVTQRAFDAHFSNLRDVASTAVNWVQASGRDLSTQFGEVAIVAAPAGSAGGQVGQGMPANVALLAQKLTGFAGKSSRGRMYLPGVPESAVDEGTGLLVAGFLALFQTSLNGFLADTSGTIDLVAIELSVVSTVQGGVDRPTAQVRPVTSLVASPFVATMRDRLKRGS